MATLAPGAAAGTPCREAADTRAFVSRAHASYDGNLRRFFASRGVARDDIDDLLQEVYLRLVRQPDSGSIRSTEAFVITTASNLLKDSFRRRLRRGSERGVEADGADLAAEGVDPERAAECSQHLQAVHRVVRALNPATRRVFLGHRLRGQSYAELAHELGVSISMIEKHMMSAIAALGPVVRECW